MGRKIVDISNFGLISREYDNLKKTDSINYKILLIKMYSNNTNGSFSYLISTDLKAKFTLKVLSQDSILYSGSIDSIGKYQTSNFLNSICSSGYFYSECNNVISSHSTEIMVVCNNSLDLWMEYVSFDGETKEVLNSDSKYTCLNKAYNLIEKVFSDLNKYNN